ncbi:MAG: hypothetical protein ACLTDX_09335 [[Clostridium] innocuum]
MSVQKNSSSKEDAGREAIRTLLAGFLIAMASRTQLDTNEAHCFTGFGIRKNSDAIVVDETLARYYHEASRITE